jgi:hypothetical protein
MNIVSGKQIVINKSKKRIKSFIETYGNGIFDYETFFNNYREIEKFLMIHAFRDIKISFLSSLFVNYVKKLKDYEYAKKKLGKSSISNVVDYEDKTREMKAKKEFFESSKNLLNMLYSSNLK